MAIKPPTVIGRYKCPICGKEFNKQNGFFYMSKSDLWKKNQTHIPVCKTCMQDLLLKYTAFYDDRVLGIKRICAMFDIYFNENTAKEAAKKEPFRMANYLGRIGKVAKTYDDTEREELAIKKALKVVKENEAKAEDKKMVENDITEDVKKFFGHGYSYDDYQFLVSHFEEWENRLGDMTVSMEGIIKNIVFNELQLTKARENGEKTEKLEATYINNLKACGLLPSQEEDSKEALDSYGKWIKKLEEDRPILDPDGMFKDVDGIEAYIDGVYKAPLADAIGIKNVFSDAYEYIKKKFSAKKDAEKVSEENEEIFARVFGD